MRNTSLDHVDDSWRYANPRYDLCDCKNCESCGLVENEDCEEHGGYVCDIDQADQ